MIFEKLDKNEMYLLVGEDFDKIISCSLKYGSYSGINFFCVDTHKIIDSPSGYKCTCENLLCWHILKVIFDKEKAAKSLFTIDDF